MTLKTIVAALGGDLYAGGLRASIPAPGHSPSDRSVSLLLSEGRVVVHTFNGTPWRDVLDQLRDRGLVDADGRLAGWRGSGSGGDALARTARQRRARAIWEEGLPAPGALSERHARLRHVRRPLPDALRHHPALPLAAYAGRGPARPALMAAILAPSGEFSGIEVTYLAPDGTRARLRTPRKTLGCVPPGSAVRLDPPGAELLVGEGVFTVLSASEVFRLPGWALLSAANLRTWRPPEGVRRVLVAADRGDVGERSARRLAEQLRRSGLAVAVRLPPQPHGDWNEAAAAEAQAE